MIEILNFYFKTTYKLINVTVPIPDLVFLILSLFLELFLISLDLFLFVFFLFFAGILPAKSTNYVCVVVIDNPRANGSTGGEVAAPLFSKLMGDLKNFFFKSILVTKL